MKKKSHNKSFNLNQAKLKSNNETFFDCIFGYIKRFNYQLLQLVIFFIIISIDWDNIKQVIIQIKNLCYSPLSYVVVTGNTQYTTNNEINQLVNLGSLDTFITQDVNIIQRQIQRFPWIQQVSVRKQWPNILKINIVEYIPVAYWNESQVISASGVIFNVPESYKHDNNLIPVLYGPEGSERDVLINYYIFNEILQFSKCKIKSVRMDTRRAWQIILHNNIHLKLGNKNIIDRLCRFIKVYPILINKSYEYNKSIDYIDLRYRSGCAIKWMSCSM